MPMLTADEIFVETLKREGIKYLFGSTGDEMLSFLDCLYQDGYIKFIDTRHENTGVLAAMGYSQATGEATVCTGTVGAGLANMFNGMFCAWGSYAPVVAVVCKRAAGLVDRHFQKAFDHSTAFRPITKWVTDVERIEHIADALQRAFRVATTPPTGPVLVSINENLFQLCNGPRLDIDLPARERYHVPALTYTDPKQAASAASMLVEARLPLLLADDRTFWNGSDAEMATLADLLAAPVFQSGHNTYPLLPEDDPLFWGFMGTRLSCSEADQLRREGDLLLAVDCTFDGRIASGKAQHEIGWIPGLFPERIIQVDSDPHFIAKFYPVSLGILGHSKAVLRQIIDQVKAIGVDSNSRRQRLDRLRQLKRQRLDFVSKQVEQVKDNVPISPLTLVRSMGEVVTPDDIVVLGGSVIAGAFRALGTFQARSSRMVSGQGYDVSLGQSLGRAIGLKLAHPNRRVSVLCGDGEFWWCNASELETLKRHRIPITIIISDNKAYGNFLNTQKKLFGGRYIGTLIEDVDFLSLARAFDMHGEKVTKPAEIKPALMRAFNSGKAALVDVRTDPFAAPPRSVH